MTLRQETASNAELPPIFLNAPLVVVCGDTADNFAVGCQAEGVRESVVPFQQ